MERVGNPFFRVALVQPKWLWDWKGGSSLLHSCLPRNSADLSQDVGPIALFSIHEFLNARHSSSG